VVAGEGEAQDRERAGEGLRHQEEAMIKDRNGLIYELDDYYESESKRQSGVIAGYCGIGMLIVWAGVGWWEIAKVFI
jgi:hypothetical protein